jgi:hypothetical protein
VRSRRNCTWVLDLSGFRVVTMESDGEVANSRVTIRIERGGAHGTGQLIPRREGPRHELPVPVTVVPQVQLPHARVPFMRRNASLIDLKADSRLAVR